MLIQEISDVSITDLSRNFARKLSEFSLLASDEAFSIVPFADPSLKHFNQLSAADQIEIAERFDQYATVMQEVKREERHLLRNPNTLWRMLARNRLRPNQDLYDSLDYNDVIEIYDMQGRQLFRSFNFFPICSYTLEQIYTLPWFDLYERDDELMKMNMDFVSEILNHPEKGTRPTPIPEHIVREHMTGHLRRTSIRPHLMSPLFDARGSVAGFVNTFQVIKSGIFAS